jgi:uncharacterized protein
MSATVVQDLARYPIKGLTGERLDQVTLSAGSGFPGDREFALALPLTVFDDSNPAPLRKFEFLMLAKQEALARLRTCYDRASGLLTVRDGEHTTRANLRTAEGREAIGRLFAGFLRAEPSGAVPRLVSAAGHRFTDVSVHSSQLMHAVSVLNLASVRDLEQRIGKPLDPRRFRANVILDGLAPWAEHAWLDRDLTIGNVRFKGARLTRRCPATEVNPDTAIRDINVPQELMRAFGHVNLGIYVYVLSDGILSIGDRLTGPI